MEAIGIDGRQPVPRRKLDYQVTMNRCQIAGCHNEAAIWLGRKLHNGALDFRSVTHFDRARFDPKGLREALDCSELGGETRWAKNRRSCCDGRDLLQHLQIFRAEVDFDIAKARRVAAGPLKAFDIAERVGGCGKYDR